jgi:farnesyl-diphosphate farnesyltransferase
MKTILPFKLSREEISYLDTWMNKVSRSFAVVVAALEEPLRHYMATAYILCRVIDNIEDCSASINKKKARFLEISNLLKEPGMAKDILKIWDSEAWPGLTQDEKNLMTSRDGFPLWQIFSELPEEVRRIIRYWTLQMADGMSQLQDPTVQPKFVGYEGIQVLAEAQDYNHYCYIVAGTVGNLATELVILHYRLSDSVANHLRNYCEACGRGLQKTNILKDFREDLTRGICYLPFQWLSEVCYTPLFLNGANRDWKRKVLVDALAELNDATNYILALPYEVIGFRLSSLLCLLPALQTILLAAQNQGSLFTDQHPAKISHQTFAQCISDARNLTKSNQDILDYYQQIEHRINQEFLGEQTFEPSINGECI